MNIELKHSFRFGESDNVLNREFNNYILGHKHTQNQLALLPEKAYLDVVDVQVGSHSPDQLIARCSTDHDKLLFLLIDMSCKCVVHL